MAISSLLRSIDAGLGHDGLGLASCHPLRDHQPHPHQRGRKRFPVPVPVTVTNPLVLSPVERRYTKRNGKRFCFFTNSCLVIGRIRGLHLIWIRNAMCHCQVSQVRGFFFLESNNFLLVGEKWTWQQQNTIGDFFFLSFGPFGELVTHYLQRHMQLLFCRQYFHLKMIVCWV